MTSSTEALYKTLQVVLIHPNSSHRGNVITLSGSGTERPYNYRTALCHALGCTRFISTLLSINRSKRYGIFVLSAFQSRQHQEGESRRDNENELRNESERKEKKEEGNVQRNHVAHAAFGLTLHGSIIMATAERCGKNQYLYNLGPICPQDVSDLLCLGRIPRFLIQRTGGENGASADGASRENNGLGLTSKHRQLNIGVSVAINEAYREWWEAFSDAKRESILRMDKKVIDNLGEHLYEFLNGMVSVWCGRCGAKYRRVRLCPVCQCVAYCADGCWKDGFRQHQDICHILAGRPESGESEYTEKES